MRNDDVFNKRNAEIRALWRAGRSFNSIARDYGLDPERVRQIVNKTERPSLHARYRQLANARNRAYCKRVYG